ncbi:hypothetical protein THAOC_07100 [Thalassiosira oceanica]|uniref:MYND-type domain-containing protein n=1 Tax=Thalassiosira oceanica TaxID=159749 RepID=K0TD84_THAOC|nr:hypothetical protein THAOC_07100 [Thalassiosira oceanica]|eukprot:EJK71456.1 hypothetical protein THAOC_07100 [Thalassiosira oceanica]
MFDGTSARQARRIAGKYPKSSAAALILGTVTRPAAEAHGGVRAAGPGRACRGGRRGGGGGDVSLDEVQELDGRPPGESGCASRALSLPVRTVRSTQLSDHLTSPDITAKFESRGVDPRDGDEACANCGKLGSDAVKLKNCNACRLVKYCGVDCQRAHRKKHKKACKQRVAELKDEQLYSQGLERPEGDFCPICTLPIPLQMNEHSSFMTCCMKQICLGCVLTAQKRGMFDCAFCRTPLAGNDADRLAMIQTRVAKKDPIAINILGQNYFKGELGLQKDARKAFELWEEAAELGSIDALFSLGNAYDLGEGVQQDKTKAAEFWTKAAMQGHVPARANLGWLEVEKGNNDRALRHYLISAKMGERGSVETIKEAFMAGAATKEQYAEALKGYQDATQETKSHDRDEAKAFLDNRK